MATSTTSRFASRTMPWSGQAIRAPRREGCGKLLIAVAIAVTSVGMSACGPSDTPEQQVRTVIAAAEDAAQRRDHGDLMALLSPGFQGARGEDAADMSRLVRGYLVTHPSVQIATRVDEVEFPYEDLAQVRLTIGALGSDLGKLDVAADAQAVTLELQLEDGKWRVTRAGWESLLGR